MRFVLRITQCPNCILYFTPCHCCWMLQWQQQQALWVSYCWSLSQAEGGLGPGLPGMRDHKVAQGAFQCKLLSWFCWHQLEKLVVTRHWATAEPWASLPVVPDADLWLVSSLELRPDPSKSAPSAACAASPT